VRPIRILGDVGERVVEPAAVAEHRRHELRGVMRPEIAGVLRHLDVARRVPLAEAVAGERHDHRPHPLDRAGVAAEGERAGEELLGVAGELLGGALLGERLPEPIGGGERHPREDGADVDHVLLIHHHPEGVGQRIAQHRVQRLVRCAVQPLEVGADVAVGGRPDDAGVEHQQVEGLRPALGAERAGGG
jgi:hypothetical protein